MLNELQNYELDELEELQLTNPISDDNINEYKERFRVKDVKTANWCFKKIKALECKINEYEDLVKVEKEKLDLWANKETKHLKDSIQFFNVLLAEYAQIERTKDPKFKLKTPNGTISFRKQQPEIVYKDVDNLIKWLEENQSDKLEDVVKIKKEISKSEFKKAFTITDQYVVTEDGEIIPEVDVIERGENIIIKTTDN